MIFILLFEAQFISIQQAIYYYLHCLLNEM